MNMSNVSRNLVQTTQNMSGVKMLGSGNNTSNNMYSVPGKND